MPVGPPVPSRGDIAWVEFSPQAGHEQGGRRPALILSPVEYNLIGLALACPITSRVKGYSFEVAIPPGLPITGVVLADQIKHIDWRARQAQLIGQAPEATVQAVLDKLVGTLLTI